MGLTLTIEGRAVGGRRPLFPEFELPVAGEVSEITLRELITRIVLAEVSDFRDRQEERRITRALTRADIEQGLMKGKVQSGGSDLDQPVDADFAIATALEAFTDGIYYVFVDDAQKTELDAPMPLRATSRVTFLRLVPLAGG